MIWLYWATRELKSWGETPESCSVTLAAVAGGGGAAAGPGAGAARTGAGAGADSAARTGAGAGARAGAICGAMSGIGAIAARKTTTCHAPVHALRCDAGHPVVARKHNDGRSSEVGWAWLGIIG